MNIYLSAAGAVSCVTRPTLPSISRCQWELSLVVTCRRPPLTPPTAVRWTASS